MELNKEKEGMFFLPSFLYLALGPLLFFIPLIIILIVFKENFTFDFSYFDNPPLHHSLISDVASKIFMFVFFIITFYHELKRAIFKLFKEKQNILYIIVGVIMIYLLTIIINLIYYFFAVEGDPTNQEILIEAIRSPLKPVMFFSIIIAAPLVEEIVLRKLLFSFIEDTLKLSQTVAIIVSSLIFAVIHVIADPKDFIFIFAYLPLSIVLTISYVISKKNIAVPISIHFFNNLISYIQVVI